MKHQHMQLALAAIWILGLVIVVAMTGYLRSISDGLFLVTLGVGPLVAMWLWWTDPAEALGRPIPTVHGDGAGKRRRR